MSLLQVCFDVESSGVDVKNDRILTCFAQVQDGDEILETREWIIDPGIEIPEEASAIHGMTTEWIREHGRKDARQAIEEIYSFLFNWSLAGHVITGFNHSFDLAMLHHEVIRNHPGAKRISLDHAQFVDPLVLDRAIDKYRKGKRTLEAVAQHYGVPFNPDEAHAADYDVKVTAQLVPKVLNAAWKKLPGLRGNSPEKFIRNLQQFQVDAKQEWASHLQEYFAKAGKTDDDGSPIVVSGAFPYEGVAS